MSQIDTSNPIEVPRRASAGVRRIGSPWAFTALLFPMIVTVLLYGLGFTNSRGVHGDSFHHVVNGVFVHDALLDLGRSVRDPWAFATHYYRHFPAVSIGYYLPGFYLIEAGFMLLFGVSAATAQLTVFIMALLMTWTSFQWMRRHLGPWWAAGATMVLLSTPVLLQAGRDILLEVPVLAFILGSILLFERLLESSRPKWSTALAWAGLTAMSFWTKQHALVLLGVFFLSTAATRRWGHLARPSIAVATALVTVAAASVLVLMFSLGGDAVGQTVGFTTQHVVRRFNFFQWMFYIKLLPELLGWFVLVLSLIGMLIVGRGRLLLLAPAISWIVCFYVMHSYFEAQSMRYACLWIPPFVLLAFAGLRQVVDRFAGVLGVEAATMPSWSKIALLAALTVFILSRPRSFDVERAPTTYQRVAADLSDRMGPFACLTFFPDNPGRMAVCFRLAIEEHRSTDRHIYSFGRILRATQTVAGWRERWPDGAALSAALRDWNVKYIVTEEPRRLYPEYGDDDIDAAIRAVLATGEFRLAREYAAWHPTHSMPNRTVQLFERIASMSYDPDADPRIRTGRVPLTIGGAQSSEAR